MTDINISTMHEHKKNRGCHNGGVFGGIYGLAFLGALIYYLQHSTSFWNGVLGILKAILWPAVLMYKVLELLKM
jgi:hypothetical protein